MKAIIGRKVGMSQIFDEKGHVIPVTVIEAGPCVVTQKKTSEKDGYEAVQLGYEDIREAKLSKPELGHLNKAGVSPKKYLRLTLTMPPSLSSAPSSRLTPSSPATSLTSPVRARVTATPALSSAGTPAAVV